MARQTKRRNNRRRGRGQRQMVQDDAAPAPAARPATWRKGVGQFVSSSFDAAAVALRARLGLNTETNFIDSISSPTTTTTLALADQGSAIPIGAAAGNGQRIGRSIRVVRWVTKGFASAAATTTLAGLVRIIAVFNRQQDAAPFTAANVLTGTTNINSLCAGDLAERGGTIVWDKTFPLIGQNNQLLAPAAPIFKPFDFEFVVPDWHMSWAVADTAGAVANNLGGALQVWVMSNGFATTLPSVFTTSRVEYVDN